jgi:hypothetical protein
MWRKAKNWTTLKYTCALPAAATDTACTNEDVVPYLAPLFRSLSLPHFFVILSLLFSLSLPPFPRVFAAVLIPDEWVRAIEDGKDQVIYSFFSLLLLSESFQASQKIFSTFFIHRLNIRFLIKKNCCRCWSGRRLFPCWRWQGSVTIPKNGTFEAKIGKAFSTSSQKTCCLKKQTENVKFFLKEKKSKKSFFVNYGIVPWWVSPQSVRGPKVFVFVFAVLANTNNFNNFNVFNVLPLPSGQQQQHHRDSLWHTMAAQLQVQQFYQPPFPATVPKGCSILQL